MVMTYLHYWTIIILLSLAQAIAMIVVAFGIIATAVCVLVGPIFIPFFIVPQLDWLFWGWLKCFIQYSFYQVVAAAVVYIIGNILTAFMNLYGGKPISLHDEAYLVGSPFHRHCSFRLRPYTGSRAHQPHLQRQRRRDFATHDHGRAMTCGRA